MKRFLVPLFSLSILLSSCGGGGNEATQCERPFWNGTIGTCLPEGWVVLDRSILNERDIPAEVITAFKREEAVAGQFPSVTITQEVLAQATDSTSYSAASVQSVTVLPGYKQADLREATVDGETVTLHIFNAQPDPEQPARRFYQVSAVSGTEGYTVTALTPLSPPRDLEAETLLMLENVTFVEPKTNEGE
ncbi:hypothetical protein HYZ99_04730 [Candidatus Peregrinibacteria bacterium]|nr:hypothetical protein [Candidatus Peregrinibacteria bacterium]